MKEEKLFFKKPIKQTYQALKPVLVRPFPLINPESLMVSYGGKQKWKSATEYGQG